MSKSDSVKVKVAKNRIAKKVQELPPSGIRKFFDLIASMEGVISLGVGEPDYTTPWHIREAAIYSLEKGYTMYTSNSGMPQLRQALSDYLESHDSLKYNPASEILITVGVSEGLDLAMRAILEPGDEVIMPDPCYVAYPASVYLADGLPVRVPTNEDNSFKISADEIEKRITDRTKAILIGYPANPTGAVMTEGDLQGIATLVQKHDLLLISDEVYGQIVYGVEHTCFASLPDMRNRTILLNGFSKAHAMTGWRIAYAAAEQEIIRAMTKIHQYSMLCAPIVSQMAAIEALKGEGDDVQEMVNDYNNRRRVMVKGFRDIGLSCFEPKGAFYAFPSISVTGMTSEEFAERLLIEEKVAVVPGNAFGPGGEGYIRCCYATSLPEIQEAIKRMGSFIKRHQIN